MTEETVTKTPEEIAAEAAVAAQGAASAAPAPEVAPAPEASQDPAAAPPEAPEAETEEPAPVHNPNALRGIPAGPRPHPRTV